MGVEASEELFETDLIVGDRSSVLEAEGSSAIDKRLSVDVELLVRTVGSEMLEIVLSKAAAAKAKKPPDFGGLFGE